MTILNCENVCMSYEGIAAVKNVSFSVEDGDYLCIVGENGSGKSTLMKGILGLKQCSSGTISFQGLKQTEIGYLPQQTQIQKDFPATVYEVVQSGCLNKRGLKPFYSKADKQNARTAMERLKLEPVAKKCYRNLSGGQQQRVLLARALCATEKLLLLDEPVSGLDPVVTAEMYEIIANLNSDRTVTVIMISHDLQSALKYGNKILHLGSDSYFFGTTDEYMKTDIYRRMIGGDSNS